MRADFQIKWQLVGQATGKLVVAAGTPEQVRGGAEPAVKQAAEKAPEAKASTKKEEAGKKEKAEEKEMKLASAAPDKKTSGEKSAEKKKTSGAKAEATMHTVKKGESAGVIAEKYGVKLSEFLAWNGLTSKSVLQAGKAYKVSGGGEAATPPSKRAAAAPAETTHKVSTGQNPTTIARRYGVKISDLYKWNNWPKNHVLQVGDTVVIRKG